MTTRRRRKRRSESAERRTTTSRRPADADGAAADPRRERRALSLLGLAKRAGRLVVGTHAVKDAARRGELSAAVVARDATENARGRVLPLLRAREVPVVSCASAVELGAAVGRSRIVVVGVTDPGFAGRVLADLPAAGRAK